MFTFSMTSCIDLLIPHPHNHPDFPRALGHTYLMLYVIKTNTAWCACNQIKQTHSQVTQNLIRSAANLSDFSANGFVLEDSLIPGALEPLPRVVPQQHEASSSSFGNPQATVMVDPAPTNPEVEQRKAAARTRALI